MTTITPLALPDVLLITPKRHGDARGWFMETWSRRAFQDAGLDIDFVQDNHAFSGEAGTVRGLHFQTAPHPQAKLLRVLRGAILDVAVDIRAGSATYGQWVSATLTAAGGEQLFVPRGFAHGYCTLEADTELAYKVDGLYAPENEGAVLWNDPDLAIDWPAFAGSVVSDKDKAARPLKEDRKSVV